MAKVGRPTAYRPEMCDRIKELGAEGYSVAEMAADIGVTRKTMYQWAEEKQEFSDAFTHAKELSLSWWEAQARIGLYNRDGVSLNASLWSRSMAARFPADYTEKRDLVSSDGSMSPKPAVDLSKAPDELLQWIVSQADAAKSE